MLITLPWCWLIRLILQAFNTRVGPPGRFLEDKAGGKGDYSDNLHAAAPSCWKCDQDALTIYSVSKMYPTAVICLFWARASFCVAHRFWLSSHISKTLWILAILCNSLSSTSHYISKTFSVFVVSNARWSPTNILLSTGANCLRMTFLQRVSPVVFDYLQPIPSCPKEKLASTQTPCGMRENMLWATLVSLG